MAGFISTLKKEEAAALSPTLAGCPKGVSYPSVWQPWPPAKEPGTLATGTHGPLDSSSFLRRDLEDGKGLTENRTVG